MSDSIDISITEITLFNNLEVRRVWHNDERYFSVSDIVYVLTESKNVIDYIKKMRNRDLELKKGWGQFVPLLWINTRWWRQKLSCTNTKWALRIIQSIPSPKAEPFKKRLASLGNERIEEINNPELWIQKANARAIQIWRNQGHDEKRITKRLQSIDTRNSFTDLLKERGIKEWFEYALLTNKVYSIWLWVSGWASEYRQLKGIKKTENLRDHMDNLEIALVDLAEAGSQKIIEEKESKWFQEVQEAVILWSWVAGEARENIEKQIGKPIVNKSNYLMSQKHKEELFKKAIYQIDDHWVVIAKIPNKKWYYTQWDTFEEARDNLKDLIDTMTKNKR
jgi:DNA-damage-inducible protein D